MNRSESLTKLAPALLIAQKKIGGAHKGAINPFFKSKYADLGAVMEACKEALNENGISVLQPIGSDENGVYVETVLLHESGEYIADRMLIAAKSANNPQDQGSAITYARRYSLQSMVFIPAEDDDANKATQLSQKPAARVEDGYTYEKTPDGQLENDPDEPVLHCETCGALALEKKGISKPSVKFPQGKSYHGIFCSTDDKSHTKWIN